MKTIELKTFGENEGAIPLKDLIAAVTTHGGSQGLSVEDLARRGRVFNAVQSASGKLELEDADYQTLMDALKVFKFANFSPSLLEAVEHLKNPSTKG